MFSDAVKSLQAFGLAVYEAFIAPGFFVHEQTLLHAPAVAKFLQFDSLYAPTLAVFLLSLLYWFLFAVLLVLLYRVCSYVVWQITATIHNAWYRLTRYARGVKTSIVLKFRDRLPKRREVVREAPMIEFDKLDIAVLRSASAIGPGLALSAPDLAERFRLRPSQVQRSLEKLSHNKMLARVIGSTDGYENFRVTDSGVAFLAMWQRQLAGN